MFYFLLIACLKAQFYKNTLQSKGFKSIICANLNNMIYQIEMEDRK